MDKKILLAGPWIGEFGWELFCWQGYIRRLSENFDKTIIICRPGHNILYDDFADEIINFDPQSYETNGWRCDNVKKSYQYLVSSINHTNYIDGQFDIGMVYNEDKLIDTKGLFYNQKYHKYESNGDYEGYDILFHSRNKKTGDIRNWNINKWIELSNKLNFKIGCVGNFESYLIDGCDDLRGIDLRDLIGIMGKSKLIIGPSSGPIHLASLCGLKHLVWSTNFNKLRYEKYWNPFNTQCIFYSDGGWDPSVNDIYNIIKNNIE